MIFKPLTNDSELDQVHRLIYRTFVEEIPQHAPNPEKKRLDPFLERSRCFVACDGDTVAGMITLLPDRPFSLDAKLPGLDRFLPRHVNACEIRLLAIEQDRRKGLIFRGLMRELLRHARDAGHDLGLISATDRELGLYRHMGFVAFGPLLGTPEARFQGMYATWDRLAPAMLPEGGPLK